jgi:glycosyltransferase involved in cell wall biosynthesis
VVVTPPAWREPGGRTLTLEPSASHPAYDLRIEPIRFNGSYHFFYWPGLGRVLRDVKPDLVHVDEEPYNVATFHATRLACQVGAQSLFFAWQNLLRRYPPPFNWFERSVFRRSAFAIAGSREALQVLRTKGFVGPASVIPQFGVDPELFTPGDAPAPEPPIIGFISRLVEEKGILILLTALAGLRRPWRLHVLGSGPLERKAHQRAAQLGVSERITWERGIPSTLVPERLRTFTVLAQPSLTRRHWKEQFGRAVMEAMACGVPVVGFASGEIPNVMGDAGLVVPEGDVAQLRQALARVLDDAELRQDLRRRGRARVLGCYTNARLAEHTVVAYQTALGAAVSPAGATIV